MTYDVFGEVVDLAKAIAAAAKPGDVMLSAACHDLVQDLYPFDPPLEQPLQGGSVGDRRQPIERVDDHTNRRHHLGPLRSYVDAGEGRGRGRIDLGQAGIEHFRCQILYRAEVSKALPYQLDIVSRHFYTCYHSRARQFSAFSVAMAGNPSLQPRSARQSVDLSKPCLATARGASQGNARGAGRYGVNVQRVPFCPGGRDAGDSAFLSDRAAGGHRAARGGG
jgi:hypothetical protein